MFGTQGATEKEMKNSKSFYTLSNVIPSQERGEKL